jgi:hypothetical protein
MAMTKVVNPLISGIGPSPFFDAAGAARSLQIAAYPNVAP